MPTATLRRQPAADTADHGKPPKLFLATPCYGGAFYMEHVHGLTVLMRSFEASKVPYRWYPLANESLITRARNRCVAEFLKTDCDALLFFDADVGFMPKDVSALVRSGFDVVCGAYPMKRYSWEAIHAEVKKGMPPHLLGELGALYAVNMTEDAQATGRCDVLERTGSRFVEVQDAATGFLLIQRHVIEAFIAKYGPEIKYTADYHPDQGKTHYAVFQDTLDPAHPVEVAKAEVMRAASAGDAEAMLKASEAYRAAVAQKGPAPRWLSEDYWFSRKCQQMGIKIYLCLDCELTHTGMHTWKGDVGKLFEVDEEKAPEPANDAGEAPDAA